MRCLLWEGSIVGVCNKNMKRIISSYNIVLTPIFCLVIGMLLYSCDDVCIDHPVVGTFKLQNSVSDTETYELENMLYQDNDKSSLDNPFDFQSISIVINDTSYFENRTHFSIKFDENSTGNFLDANDESSLNFEYDYVQDSEISVVCTNGYEYKFVLDGDCKLEHCVYLVSTFKTSSFRDYDIVYSTYCYEKSFDDAANEYLSFAGENAFDTIGINKYTLIEKK